MSFPVDGFTVTDIQFVVSVPTADGNVMFNSSLNVSGDGGVPHQALGDCVTAAVAAIKGVLNTMYAPGVATSTVTYTGVKVV